MSKTEILIGCDPELFLRNKKTGQLVSAHEYFPGSKHEPFYVKSGAIQVDGVAAEFNINPAIDANDFLLNIGNVTDVMKTILSNQDGDLELCIQPTAVFDRAYFDALPENVRELGCSPDFDAWSGRINERPSTTEPFRTGAGHIHVGWADNEDITDPEFVRKCREVVKTLDASLFVMSHAWDDDRKRRTLYGKSGAFRTKLYGVEYRVLSNQFLADIDVINWVYNAAYHSAELVLDEGASLYKSQLARTFLNIGEKHSGSYSITDYHEYNEFLSKKWGYEMLDSRIIDA